MTAQALYRFFDDGGQLLYVGITSSPGHRFDQHAGEKVWWPDVRGISLEWYATRPEVEAAEKRTIKIENPRWNVVHRDQARAARPSVARQVASLALTSGRTLTVGGFVSDLELGEGTITAIVVGGPDGAFITVDFPQLEHRTWPIRPDLVP